MQTTRTSDEIGKIPIIGSWSYREIGDKLFYQIVEKTDEVYIVKPKLPTKSF